MTRIWKLMLLIGSSSVVLQNTPCTFQDHGFSMIPNGIIPNPFAGLL